MGGRTALGYDVKERKLVINKKKAQQVRYFYELFAETESLTETCRVINREGYRTKVFRKEGKKPTGGNRWTRATLHRLLKNRLYLGEITDKRRNKCYPGEHEAIIDQTFMGQGAGGLPNRMLGSSSRIVLEELHCLFARDHIRPRWSVSYPQPYPQKRKALPVLCRQQRHTGKLRRDAATAGRR